MSQKRDKLTLKILLGILVLFLMGLGVFTFSFYQSKQSEIQDLQAQKSEIRQKLKDIEARYEDIAQKNIGLSQKIKGKQKRIERLLDSLHSLEKNIQKLNRFRLEARRLARQNRRFRAIIDSLANRSERLSQNIDSVTANLEKRESAVDSLREANEELKKQLKRIKKFSLDSLNLVEIARKQDSLQICFRLQKKGKSETISLYIQVIAPGNTVIGKARMVRFGEKKLIYSKRISCFPKNEKKYCYSVYFPEDKAKSGRYWVNIFRNDELMASRRYSIE